MQNKSPKSELLEYCQKLGKGSPLYEVAENGPPHLRCFKAEVILDDGKRFRGDTCSTKSEAQHDAAHAALTALRLLPTVPTPTLTTPAEFEAENPRLDRVVCIIDYENLPNMVPIVQRYRGLQTYIVVGEHHHKSEEEFPWAIKLLCPSMATNAVDLCITMLVGALLQANDCHTFILVSRDKFVATVAELIRNSPKRVENLITTTAPPKEAIIATTENHIVQAMQKLS